MARNKISNSGEKSYVIAYLLWFFLGWFGAHRFYLRDRFGGVLYFFTGAQLSMGWIIDGCCMHTLIKRINEDARQGKVETKLRTVDFFIYWLPPGGLLGTHRFAAGDYVHGVLYFITGGGGVIAWLFDGTQLHSFARRMHGSDNDYLPIATSNGGQMILPESSNKDRYNLADVYALYLNPLNFLGVHHFYLGRTCYGICYLLTGGFCYIGVMVDFFILPYLVEKANNDAREKKNSMPMLVKVSPQMHQPIPGATTYVVAAGNAPNLVPVQVQQQQHFQQQQQQQYQQQQPQQSIPQQQPIPQQPQQSIPQQPQMMVYQSMPGYPSAGRITPGN